jgi:hypothetical protein
MSDQRNVGDSAQPEYETPYYAHFEHPDGSWYLLWITHTQPRTARGHPWHVHASFDKHGGIQPAVGGGEWNMAPYGMHNWDFDEEADALKEFDERFQTRLEHGYTVVRARLPEKQDRQ